MERIRLDNLDLRLNNFLLDYMSDNTKDTSNIDILSITFQEDQIVVNENQVDVEFMEISYKELYDYIDSRNVMDLENFNSDLIEYIENLRYNLIVI